MDLTSLSTEDFSDEFSYADCYGTAQSVTFVVKSFLGNRPAVHAVTGISSVKGLEAIATKTLSLNATESLSGGGNGTRTFTLPAGDALYLLSGIREASKRTCSCLLVVSGGKVLALSPKLKTVQDLLLGAAAKAASATKLYTAQVEAANKVIQSIEEERQQYGEEVIDDVIARPEFGNLPDVDRVIGLMQADGFDPDMYAVEKAAPIHYVVTAPAYAKAATAEEAVAVAKKIVEDRQRAAEDAKAKAEESGLPQLTGSPRQIPWALQIRAAVLKANPKHPSLRRATTAKYWIEHRDEFQ